MRVRLVFLAVISVFIFACGSSPTTDSISVPVDAGTAGEWKPSKVTGSKQSEVGASSTATYSTHTQPGGSGVGGSEELLTVVPPCLPVVGSLDDPCPEELLPLVDTYGVQTSLPRYVSDVPSASDIMKGLDPRFPIVKPHIVVRATVLPGTTRCNEYLVINYGFEGDGGWQRLYYYLCFADVRVNEYYIGAGASRLTVAVHGEPVILADGREWADIDVIHGYLRDPRSRTAAAYEGREVVMFLRPTLTMAVESWAVEGTYDMWYVRKDRETQDDASGGLPESTSSEGKTVIKTGLRYGEHILLEMTLDDLATELRNLAPTPGSSSAQEAESAATASSSTTAGSSTSTSLPPIPPLVRRSDQLRTFYVASGAVYEGENITTVMPPPVPGQDTTSTTAGPTTSTTAAPTSTTTKATSTATTTQVERPGTPQNVAVSDSGVVTWDPPGSGGPVTSYIVYVSGHGNIPTGPDNRSADISHWIEASKGSTVRVYVIARNLSGWSRDSGIVTLNL